jgi:hypothetical protein
MSRITRDYDPHALNPPEPARDPRRPARRARLRAQRPRALERPIPRRRRHPATRHRPPHHRRRPPAPHTPPARAHQDARPLPLHPAPRPPQRKPPTTTPARPRGLAYVPVPLLPDGRVVAEVASVDENQKCDRGDDERRPAENGEHSRRQPAERAIVGFLRMRHRNVIDARVGLLDLHEEISGAGRPGGPHDGRTQGGVPCHHRRLTANPTAKPPSLAPPPGSGALVQDQPAPRLPCSSIGALFLQRRKGPRASRPCRVAHEARHAWSATGTDVTGSWVFSSSPTACTGRLGGQRTAYRPRACR